MANNYQVNVTPYLYASGCVVYVTDSHEAFISPGEVRDDTNRANIIISSKTPLSGIRVGINALDKGVLQPSTMYNVYVIGDESGRLQPAALLSLGSIPKYPTIQGITYNLKRLVGYLRTNNDVSSSAPYLFTSMYVTGQGVYRTVLYNPNDQNNSIFSNYITSAVQFISFSSSLPSYYIDNTIIRFHGYFFTICGNTEENYIALGTNPVGGNILNESNYLLLSFLTAVPTTFLGGVMRAVDQGFYAQATPTSTIILSIFVDGFDYSI